MWLYGLKCVGGEVVDVRIQSKIVRYNSDEEVDILYEYGQNPPFSKKLYKPKQKHHTQFSASEIRYNIH